VCVNVHTRARTHTRLHPCACWYVHSACSVHASVCACAQHVWLSVRVRVCICVHTAYTERTACIACMRASARTERAVCTLACVRARALCVDLSLTGFVLMYAQAACTLGRQCALRVFACVCVHRACCVRVPVHLHVRLPQAVQLMQSWRVCAACRCSLPATAHLLNAKGFEHRPAMSTDLQAFCTDPRVHTCLGPASGPQACPPCLLNGCSSCSKALRSLFALQLLFCTVPLVLPLLGLDLPVLLTPTAHMEHPGCARSWH